MSYNRHIKKNKKPINVSLTEGDIEFAFVSNVGVNYTYGVLRKNPEKHALSFYGDGHRGFFVVKDLKTLDFVFKELVNVILFDKKIHKEIIRKAYSFLGIRHVKRVGQYFVA